MKGELLISLKRLLNGLKDKADFLEIPNCAELGKSCVPDSVTESVLQSVAQIEVTGKTHNTGTRIQPFEILQFLYFCFSTVVSTKERAMENIKSSKKIVSSAWNESKKIDNVYNFLVEAITGYRFNFFSNLIFVFLC